MIESGPITEAFKLAHTRQLVGAENRVTLCDMQVLVDEAAEPVSSEHAGGRPRTWRGAASGRALIQGSVRSVRVEVPDVLA